MATSSTTTTTTTIVNICDHKNYKATFFSGCLLTFVSVLSRYFCFWLEKKEKAHGKRTMKGLNTSDLENCDENEKKSMCNPSNLMSLAGCIFVMVIFFLLLGVVIAFAPSKDKIGKSKTPKMTTFLRFCCFQMKIMIKITILMATRTTHVVPTVF